MTHKTCVETSSVNMLHHLWKTGWKVKWLNDTAHLRLRLSFIDRESCKFSGENIFGNEENFTFPRVTSMVENQSRRISKNKLAKCAGFSGRAKLGL
ncbi:unnamed protein product [Brassica oleracea var. botrytis]